MQKTLENLAAAFVGESQARNRYTIYGKAARKAGYIEAAAAFELAAEHESIHASNLYKMMTGLMEKSGAGQPEIKTGVAVSFGSVEENLKASAHGESHEHTSMYPGFAEVAQAEGLPDIAAKLRAIAKAEAYHEEMFLKILQGITSGSASKSDSEVDWVCAKCGCRTHGKTPPEKCPACGHPAGYFKKQ